MKFTPSKEAQEAAKEMYHKYIIGMKRGSGRHELAVIIDKHIQPLINRDVRNVISNF